MQANRKLLVLLSASAYANAAFDFRIDPTCVPDPSSIPNDDILAELLPSLCDFGDADEVWTGLVCSDAPAECMDSNKKKLAFAVSKRYVTAQGTDNPGCNTLSFLSRDVEFPECVFGEPVPEITVGDLVNSANNARDFYVKVLSSNPTLCATRQAIKAYIIIYADMLPTRISEIAFHGHRFNPDKKLQDTAALVDMSTFACKSEEETKAAMKKRLARKDYTFSRKAFDDCTLIRSFRGSTFATEIQGSHELCKLECNKEDNCNAFNIDLRFDISLGQGKCDLLQCPRDATMSDKVDFGAYYKTMAFAECGKLTTPKACNGVDHCLFFGGKCNERISCAGLGKNECKAARPMCEYNKDIRPRSNACQNREDYPCNKYSKKLCTKYNKAFGVSCAWDGEFCN